MWFGEFYLFLCTTSCALGLYVAVTSRGERWQPMIAGVILLLHWMTYNFAQFAGVYSPERQQFYELALGGLACWLWVQFRFYWCFGYLAAVLGARSIWHALHGYVGFDAMVYANVNGSVYFAENIGVVVVCFRELKDWLNTAKGKQFE